MIPTRQTFIPLFLLATSSWFTTEVASSISVESPEKALRLQITEQSQKIVELTQSLQQLKEEVEQLKSDGGMPKNYVQKCYSGDIGSGHNVHESNGEHKYRDVTVHFPQAFRTTPTVSVGLRQFDLGQWSFAFSWINPYHKINVWVIGVSSSHLTVRFQAKDDSEILYATANYMACA